MITVLFSLLLGVAAVFQGMLNRQISDSWGLASTIMLNNIVLLVAGGVIFIGAKYYPEFFPDFFSSKKTSIHFTWYYLLPGLFGILLVAGIPFAISKIGALNVFVGIVTAQVLTSLVLDYFIESIPVSWPRILGALLTVLGVFLFRIKS